MTRHISLCERGKKLMIVEESDTEDAVSEEIAKVIVEKVVVICDGNCWDCDDWLC